VLPSASVVIGPLGFLPIAGARANEATRAGEE